MKNQYFGDNRDLFKYDLITEIMLGMPALDKFTFIPMLTPKDARSDGNDRDIRNAKAGFKNEDLVQFLKSTHLIKKEERDIRIIEKYFEKKGIKAQIFDYRGNGFFSKENRSDYFESIKSGLLHNSLVFLDPDNGLEIKRSTERHVLYSEIEGLFNRANQSKTIIMIIQFFPREEHQLYIRKRLSEFTGLNCHYVWIADSNTVFFILTKDNKYLVGIKNILRTYQASYKKTIKIGD